VTVRIDCDLLLYQGLFSAEKAEITSFYKQLRNCEDILESILYRVEHDDYELVLSGSANFRFKIYKDYKANRSDKPKPRYLQDAKEYFRKYWDAVVTTGYEADDYIAMHNKPGDVIAANDKDFDQIEGGLIFNWQRNEFHRVLNPCYHFCEQMLIGDTADNVPGVPNPEKAHHKNPPNFTKLSVHPLLSNKTEKEMKSLVVEMYQTAYGDEWFEYFDRNGRLLWLLRNEKDNFIKHW
jgi:hypothetical protein